MKKAFSNLFGGKREKEKDKAGDAAGEERLQAGTSAAGEPASAATLSRLQSPPREPEQLKQHKHKDKHDKHGKQSKHKSGSGKSRDSQPPPPQSKAEKQRKVSGQETEAAGEQQPQQLLQARQNSSEEPERSERPESLLQSPTPAGELGVDVKQQQSPQQSTAESAADNNHLQQKIATLQGHILELESALEAAGVPPSPSPPPGSDGEGGGWRVSRPQLESQACQTEVEKESVEGRCPACGRAETGEQRGTSTQTDSSGTPGPCVTCGSVMAGGRVAERGVEVTESGARSESGTPLCAGVDIDDPELRTESAQSVPEPGDLSSEVARLASVQQRLQKSPPLPAKLPPSPSAPPATLTCAEVQTECSQDQLTRELQELMDKYAELRRSCDALEEQKNELEEAENDARLMVQRQEVQIITAGEVERMLSSELAEEQERCSQLQRQLNSVRLKHQAALRARQADSETSSTQAAQLVRELQEEVDVLRQKLAQRDGSDSRRDNVSVVVVDAGARTAGEGASPSPSPVSPEPGTADDRAREECASPLTAASHTEKSSTFSDSGVGEDMSHTSGVVSPSPPSPHALSETGRTRNTSDARPESRLSTHADEQLFRCIQCSRELSRELLRELGGLSTTASAGNSLLTIAGADQERYLAAALQLLETQQGGAAGEGAGRDAAEAEGADESLTRQVTLLQTELGAQLGTFEETRQALARQHERQLHGLRAEQAELQRQLAAALQLQAELSSELDLPVGPDEETLESEPRTALLRAVRETRQREQHLSAHCADLEKKEGAYRETLEEADRIMHSVEMRYQKNIEELENQLRESKNRINFMEGTEEQLKQALYTSSGKRDQQRVAELLDKLIETENEDLKLKDKVYRLERREREQSIRLREEQRAAEQLRIELRDQEELLRELDAARGQLAAAAEQPAALAALQARAAELQRSEQRLRARVEELEQSEQALHEQLSDDRQQFALRERRLGEQVDCRQRELESLQAVLVEMQLQEVAGSEERAQLRRELQQLQQQYEQLGGHAAGDGAAGLGAIVEHESRAEVGKLRSQLSQAHLQITENEEMSCQLREQIEQLQSEHAELRQHCECQRARAEQDLEQLTAELRRRDSEAAALSAQLAEHDRRQATRELDALAEQEGSLVKLLALVTATERSIQGCDSCRRSTDGVLAAVAVSLQQVILLISGGSSDQSLQAQLRDAETLAAATARLSAPPPGVSTGVQTASPPGVSTGDPQELHESLELSQQQLELSRRELELRTEELEARGCELRLLRDQLAQQQRQLRRRLAQQAAQSSAATEAKDRLLGALLRRLRRVLTAQQSARLAAELRDAGEGDGDRQSFDLDAVCQVLQQNTRAAEQQSRGKTPPVQVVEKPSERSLDSLENSSNSNSSSRIPRLFNSKPKDTSPTETVASRKRSPPSKVPLPRRNTPSRSSGPPVLPPVGVARPYRSASSPGLAPASASSTGPQREWSPAPSLTRECSPAPTLPPPSPAPTPAPAAKESSPAPRAQRPPSPDCLLPPPDGFQIVRAVGGDSLLLYWSPVEDPRITGYQIFVDSQLQLSIRNPQRTKALLPALDLGSPLRLGIRAVAPGETYSALACADHRPGKLTASA